MNYLSLLLPIVLLIFYFFMAKAGYEDERNKTCKSMIWTKYFGTFGIAMTTFLILLLLYRMYKLE